MGVLGALTLLISSSPFTVFAQFATPDRVSDPGFWPTQRKYSRDEFAGSAGCAECHAAITATQRETSMARTAMRAGDSAVLQSHPELDFAPGGYYYSIRSSNGESAYTVLKGPQAESAPLVWAFGTSRIAQSFLFKKKNGEFREARVTYFRTLDALSFTPGRALKEGDADVEEAMDREMSWAEVYRCFGCHTTASGTGNFLDEARLIPGVSCEACHGPGSAHVAEMQGAPVQGVKATEHVQGEPEAIFNPKRLTPEESVDFCGACHGSYWDVSLSGSLGAGNARFQPYRLEQSKCWNKNDARLTCVACHDPHKEVEKDAAAYDHVCLSCHLTKGKATAKADTASARAAAALAATHPGASCPVAAKECTSCHMPQVYVPVMHQSFPDHRIRIAREGEAFPD